jgi:hypothetical protein
MGRSPPSSFGRWRRGFVPVAPSRASIPRETATLMSWMPPPAFSHPVVRWAWTAWVARQGPWGPAARCRSTPARLGDWQRTPLSSMARWMLQRLMRLSPMRRLTRPSRAAMLFAAPIRRVHRLAVDLCLHVTCHSTAEPVPPTWCSLPPVAATDRLRVPRAAPARLTRPSATTCQTAVEISASACAERRRPGAIRAPVISFAPGPDIASPPSMPSPPPSAPSPPRNLLYSRAPLSN